MNRSERLHAIHEALRRSAHRGMSASQLSDHFEVSARTIKRDISALQQAGSPIWAQPGPGGGYRLDAAATLGPVAFSPSQAVATIVALAVLPPGSPFAIDAKVAADKVLDTLGSPARGQAEALADRIWVRHLPPEQKTAPPILRAVERSLAERLAVNINYRSAKGQTTSRTIEPVIIAWSGDQWFLVAFCRLRQAIRWFRLDRIDHANCTRQQFDPKPVETIGAPPVGASPVNQ